MYMNVEFSLGDMELIKNRAAIDKISAEEFIRQSSLKAARNAEYLAKLDKGFKQAASGNGKVKTWAELEELISDQNFHR